MLHIVNHSKTVHLGKWELRITNRSKSDQMNNIDTEVNYHSWKHCHPYILAVMEKKSEDFVRAVVKQLAPVVQDEDLVLEEA